MAGRVMTIRPRKFGPRLTVSLTSNDYDALNALADRDEVSVSWVVRRAIEEYLRGRNRDSEGAVGALAPTEGN